MLEKASLIDYMEFLISTQDVLHPKPHSQMYDTAIAKLGLLPKECLIVEDNENGIKAATASGAHVLKVKSVEEVNYHNIVAEIERIEGLQ
jgi:HAD superfamily hydrolase (TIGR01509 family)